MQEIEIGAHVVRKPPARINQPGIEPAAGNGAVQERQKRDEIERQRDRRFDAQGGLPDDELTHPRVAAVAEEGYS